LTHFDVTSAIQESLFYQLNIFLAKEFMNIKLLYRMTSYHVILARQIFYLLNIFLAHEYLILNFLYILILLMLPKPYRMPIFDLLNSFLVKGPSKGFKQYKHRLLLVLYKLYRGSFLTHENSSGPRVLDLELSKHTHWLLLMLLQPYKGPYFTYGIYFWPNNSWTLSYCTERPLILLY
jgi:hypothetical protein